MFPLSARSNHQAMPAASQFDQPVADDCLGMSIELHPFDGELDEEVDEPLFSDTESSQERDFASDSDSNSDSEDGYVDDTPPSSPPSSPSSSKFSHTFLSTPLPYSNAQPEADQHQWLQGATFAAGDSFWRQSPEPRPSLTLAAASQSAKITHPHTLDTLSSNIAPLPLEEPAHEPKDSRFVSIAHLRLAPLPAPCWNRRRFSDFEDSLRRQVLEKAAFRVGQLTEEGEWWFETSGGEMTSVF